MHVDSVFDRFYRADNSASRSTEGTGIGLSLVKELVRLHGGQVGVESQVGVGSTFHVWLPRGIDHLPHDRISGLADPGDKEAQAYENLVGKDSTPSNEDLPRSAMERWNKRANGVEREEILNVSRLMAFVKLKLIGAHPTANGILGLRSGVDAERGQRFANGDDPPAERIR